MTSNIKLIVESLFDDEFDSLYNTQNEFDLSSYNKSNKLTECYTAEDVAEYIDKKYNITNIILPLIQQVYDSFITGETIKGERIYASSGKTLDNNIAIKDFYIGYATNTDNSCYIIRDFNNEVNSDTINPSEFELLFVYFFDGFTRYHKILAVRPRSEFIPTKYVMNKSASLLSPHTKAARFMKMADNYNNQIAPMYMQNLLYVINSGILSLYKCEKLAEEMTCKGKVYKVVLKDIDRMKKCLDTNEYTGFNLIKNPAKMVARLTALFLVAEHRGNSAMKLEFNDDILLKIFCNGNYNTYQTSKNNMRYKVSKSDYYITVLKSLISFEGIHLKDVIATFNAYKNEPFKY